MVFDLIISFVFVTGTLALILGAMCFIWLDNRFPKFPYDSGVHWMPLEKEPAPPEEPEPKKASGFEVWKEGVKADLKGKWN